MSTDNLIKTEDAQQVANILQSASAQKLVTAAALLVGLLIITHFLVALLKRFLKKTQRISKSVHTLLIYTVRYVLILLSVMIAANSVGVPITAFVALFSIFGVAISLALQGVLANVAGGIILVSGKQFEVGDYIETASGSGTVEDISMVYTRLGNPGGTKIYLPNSALYTSPVTNVTSSGKRRIAQVYTAAYQHSPEEVRAAIEEVLSQLDTVLPDPAPSVVVDSYARTYVNYKCFCWTKTADYWPTIHKMNELMYQAFAKHHIEWADPKVAVVTTD